MTENTTDAGDVRDTAAIERMRRWYRGDVMLTEIYPSADAFGAAESLLKLDIDTVVRAAIAQSPTYAEIAAQLATIKAEAAKMRERLGEIERHAKHDEADMQKMRDGTKLTRFGLVEVISYQGQDIDELTAQLAAANARLAEMDDPSPLTAEQCLSLGGTWAMFGEEVYWWKISETRSLRFWTRSRSIAVVTLCGDSVVLMTNPTIGDFRKLLAGLRIEPKGGAV